LDSVADVSRGALSDDQATQYGHRANCARRPRQARPFGGPGRWRWWLPLVA